MVIKCSQLCKASIKDSTTWDYLLHMSICNTETKSNRSSDPVYNKIEYQGRDSIVVRGKRLTLFNSILQ